MSAVYSPILEEDVERMRLRAVPIQATSVTPLLTISEEQEKLFDELAELRDLEVNWDTYGSARISRAALNVAGEVVRVLTRKVAAAAFIAPISGGGIQFEWEKGELLFELEIRPDGRVFYGAYRGPDQMANGRLPEGRAVAINKIVEDGFL